MKVSRRSFLKLSGATAALASLVQLGFDMPASAEIATGFRIKHSKAVPTICPYCSAGCGLLAHVDEAKGILLFTEGDPDHPINEGGACSKGASVFQLNSEKVGVLNKNRLSKPLYRAPGTKEFKAVDWEWAFEEITKRIKETRDKNFIPTQDGVTVNRTEAIAQLGGAGLDNEECYLLQKFARALGIVYLEHQARI